MWYFLKAVKCKWKKTIYYLEGNRGARIKSDFFEYETKVFWDTLELQKGKIKLLKCVITNNKLSAT